MDANIYGDNDGNDDALTPIHLMEHSFLRMILDYHFVIIFKLIPN